VACRDSFGAVENAAEVGVDVSAGAESKQPRP
jgi:hypothetical protein